MCIKYGEPVKDSEKITLDQFQLNYYETVRHLGNFLNTDNNCTRDINYKCSSFIGYFNKMMSHYSQLHLMSYVDYLSHTVVFYVFF